MKTKLTVIFLGIIFIAGGCSNYSLLPDHIPGKKAKTTIEAALSEIMILNPATAYLVISMLARSNPDALTGGDAATLGASYMALATISAKNWTSNVVDENKYYVKKEVMSCAAQIKSTGHVLNYLATSMFGPTSGSEGLLLGAMIPNIVTKACDLKPVKDLLIIESGQETSGSDN